MSTYKDFDLEGLETVIGHDGREAAREALRQLELAVEAANRQSKEGVVEGLEQARSYLDSAVNWAGS